jgi:hypothetical protein
VGEADLVENEPSPRKTDVLKALSGLGFASVRDVNKWMCSDNERAFNTGHLPIPLPVMGTDPQ